MEWDEMILKVSSNPKIFGNDDSKQNLGSMEFGVVTLKANLAGLGFPGIPEPVPLEVEIQEVRPSTGASQELEWIHGWDGIHLGDTRNCTLGKMDGNVQFHIGDPRNVQFHIGDPRNVPSHFEIPGMPQSTLEIPRMSHSILEIPGNILFQFEIPEMSHSIWDTPGMSHPILRSQECPAPPWRSQECPIPFRDPRNRSINPFIPNFFFPLNPAVLDSYFPWFFHPRSTTLDPREKLEILRKRISRNVPLHTGDPRNVLSHFEIPEISHSILETPGISHPFRDPRNCSINPFIPIYYFFSPSNRAAPRWIPGRSWRSCGRGSPGMSYPIWETPGMSHSTLEIPGMSHSIWETPGMSHSISEIPGMFYSNLRSQKCPTPYWRSQERRIPI
ncbi:hypothetical protein DUI87_33498 [Hirundo rustica rustica]|uniref:Uncharacterized protein n=1 Tax=Hirundo rustica rustica TaxID=333673 RepID=A0A3M0IL44_HIRRU|nr:hypothetical protein DUI87_33498 [Hirundo rustica rustica]